MNSLRILSLLTAVAACAQNREASVVQRASSLPVAQFINVAGDEPPILEGKMGLVHTHPPPTSPLDSPKPKIKTYVGISN